MNKSFRFWGSLAAFLICAGVSCWATVASLKLLMPTGWPVFLIWVITIAFFAMASIGSYLVVNSLMSKEYVENRKGKLVGGILLLVFFWLLMSMPTNTHTFFYHDKIGTVIAKDVETTNAYLTQLVVKGNSGSMTLDAEGRALKNAVEEERKHIVAQFNGDEPPYKRGNGKIIGEHLNRIDTILNASIKQHPNYNSTDPTILNQYQVAIDKALNDKLATHTVTREDARKAQQQIDRLERLNDSIQVYLSVGSLPDEVIKQCEKEIHDGYIIINSKKDFIDWAANTDDEEVYTRENGETRTKRMASVIDVFFVDFLSGKYPASFWYYVLLSLLFDVCAFIFFDIAFSKKQY